MAAKSLMIQGTCSGAGKSLLVAGLCRIFANRGVRVAPFKAQNMALNSYITREGAEIGRAQALQAEAARVEAHADMNPVLLKAQGERGCQVILQGRVHGNMSAQQYYAFKNEAWRSVEAAWQRMSEQYDLVLIEGAGSPAEINLSDVEIVNMRVARHTQSPVLLVGDIDRGGVFASFYGTVALVGDDARFIKGFVINRFRGDPDILTPGFEMMRERTGVPTLGVVPYVRDLGLDEEDGLSLTNSRGGMRTSAGGAALRVVVLRLNYISNFTDFDALAAEPDVDLIFSANPAEVQSADMLIVPGSKNTVMDLLALRAAGLDESVRRAARQGVRVVGLCGGYQMLGQRIVDPDSVESPHREVAGMALLDVETTFAGTKVTTRCTASTEEFGGCSGLAGYEIHMGRTTGDIGLFNVHRLATDGGAAQDGPVAEGSRKGNVWGTYLHGIFDNDSLRHAVLDELRQRRNLSAPQSPLRYQALREANMDRWARMLEGCLDMKAIEDMIFPLPVRGHGGGA